MFLSHLFCSLLLTYLNSLRHVEDYREILFLTTNRVKAFDEAFLSCIHVSLHFRELTQESKEQVWAAFIAKMGSSAKNITTQQIKELAKRGINERQLKNAARTAHPLAVGKGKQVDYEHLRLTLDAMDEFTREFEKRNQRFGMRILDGQEKKSIRSQYQEHLANLE